MAVPTLSVQCTSSVYVRSNGKIACKGNNFFQHDETKPTFFGSTTLFRATVSITKLHKSPASQARKLTYVELIMRPGDRKPRCQCTLTNGTLALTAEHRGHNDFFTRAYTHYNGTLNFAFTRFTYVQLASMCNPARRDELNVGETGESKLQHITCSIRACAKDYFQVGSIN